MPVSKEPAGLLRRDVLVSAAATAAGAALFQACATTAKAQGPASADGLLDVSFTVNGEKRTLQLEPRVTLLDALRERLGLTGSKKGCDMGQCGACTVLVDGQRINSCLSLAVQQEGREITTIEGLAKGTALHPMQEAFIACDALQCGYCTPGQILSAVALTTHEPKAASDDEIRERMSGNLCRCGAYPNILAAIRQVQP